MRAGRKSKLTPEVLARLCDALRAGDFYQNACRFAGVDYSSFRRWMVKGEKAKRGEFRELYDAVTRALAECEVELVRRWKAQTANNWQACRDLLARRFPERWAPRAQHELTGKGGKPLPRIRVIRSGPSRSG
jgi:hypothetical protein